MNKIELKQVLQMHKMIITQTGGIDGVRDLSILESALKAPFQTFFGEDLYSTIEEKAVRLCFGLIKNHAFYNGNKRIGILVFLTFLEINDIKNKFTDKELIDIGYSVVSDKMSFEDLVKITKQKINKQENYENSQI